MIVENIPVVGALMVVEILVVEDLLIYTDP
jgi:hypothetical protein